MTQNLDTADRITKVTLSLLTLFFYSIDVINGPFAMSLMIVSIMVLVISFVKLARQSVEK